MWCQRILFLVICCMAAYGDYLIATPKESDVDIPESLEELEKTFPHGSDWMRLLRASSAIAKYGALKLIFRNPPDKSNEIVLEKSIFLYLPHQENVPNTNYRVDIRDLFTGRVIAHKFLSIQNSGWYKVLLNRWLEDSRRGLGLISANHGLEIRLRQKGGKKFDFEEFYKSNENLNHKFLPSLFIYYKNMRPLSLKDLFNFTDESLRKLHSNLPAKPRLTKRSTANTPCSYFVQDMFTNLNLSTIKPFRYFPNATRVCTGSCSPNSTSTPSTSTQSTSSKCDRKVQDCCVPSKRRAFVMLYMDDKNILALSVFPDMIVEKCACASSIVKTGTGNKG